MSKNNHQKIDELNQKIIKLKEEKEKIQQEIFQDFEQILTETNAFQIDFHTLVGGLLHIIESSKLNTTMAKEWQITGQKFCRSRLKKDTSSSKKSSKPAPQSDQAA